MYFVVFILESKSVEVDVEGLAVGLRGKFLFKLDKRVIYDIFRSYRDND